IQTNFRSKQNHLRAGEYIFDDWLNYIYHKDSTNKQQITMMLSKRPKKLLHIIAIILIKNIFFKENLIVENIKLERKFAGTVYLPANNKEENATAKIFDFKNKKVLS